MRESERGAAERPSRLTAEEAISLYAEPGVHGYEYVNGELEPVSPANPTHGRVILELGHHLLNHIDAHGGGRVYADAGFVLALTNDPERMRGPDVAFVSDERIAAAGGEPPRGFFRVIPDLAAEIFSPTNQREARQFAQRVRDLLDAGVRLLWVIYPDARYAVVHRPDGSARIIRDDEALDGEDVLPGFRLPLNDLLR
ncbi:MAG: Uma2 family endonuclease [Gemmatimonadetes bacterium]|nr:Uma2 family endonuclease [Gemmatimonadota bacterium]